nr:MAG TPA: hypothetical protein [Caudoviricetes sp.]
MRHGLLYYFFWEAADKHYRPLINLNIYKKNTVLLE